MKIICKRLLAAFLTAALLLSCFVVASADDVAEAQKVVDTINNLSKKFIVYHNADAVDNSVVNINSGSFAVATETQNKTQGEGSVKVSAKNAITKNAFSVGFRADAVTLNEYDTMTFDMFIPEGTTVPADTYGYAYFANKHVTNQDDRVWRYEIKAQAIAAKAGEWTTFTVPVADQNYAGIVQISLRLAITTSKDGYVLLDNIQFIKNTDVTYAQKDAIQAAVASYNALTDSQKALVTNIATLEGYQAMLAAVETNAKVVSDAITALPALQDITLNDEAKIAEVRASYQALTDEEKSLVTNLEILVAAEEHIALLSTPEMKAKAVMDLISALPSADNLSLENEAQVQAARDAYEALDDESKAFVTNLTTLNVAEEKIATIKANLAAAGAVEDMIANLSVTNDLYHSADAVDNSVVNINSGSFSVATETQNKTQGEGSIKVSAKNAVTKNAFCVGFRANAVTLNEYDTMTFDMFISQEVSVPADGYGSVYFHSVHTNNQDNPTAAYKTDLKALCVNLEKGQWHTITIPVANLNHSNIIQISMRLAITTTTNGYILLDNIQFNKTTEITYAHKETIDAIASAYSALTDDQKALVSNYALLEEYLTIIAQMERNAADVADMIEDLPIPTDVDEYDQEAIEAARNAFDALSQEEKDLVVNQDKLIQVEQALVSFMEAEKAKAQAIVDAISNLPALNDIALEDQETIESLLNDYEALKELIKPFVTNYDTLVAARNQIDVIKAQEKEKANQLNNAIKGIEVDATLFSNCDQIKDGANDVAVNINSGGMDISVDSKNCTEGYGAIKVQKKSNRTDYPEHVVGLRGTATNITEYTHIAFDLYLTESYTVSPTFAQVVLHSTNANATEQNILVKIDIKDLIGNAKLGQWNHISVAIPAIEGETTTVKQVSIRIGSNFLVGDNAQYLLIDNVCLIKERAFTYDDKRTVEKLKATYDALSDYGKSFVTTLNTLNGYLERIQTIEETMEAFKAAIDGLTGANVTNTDVTNTDLTFNDLEALKAARELYDTLDNYAKSNCTEAYQNLFRLEAEMKALVETTAKQVSDLIAALPAIDQVTLADETAYLDALNTYNALPQEVKSLVKNADTLQTVSDRLDVLKKVQNVIDMIDALPEEIVTATDIDAVNAAKDAYDALSEDQKALVTNYQTLVDALAQIEKSKVTLGDLNDDGYIDAKDALIVLKIAVKKQTATERQAVAGDVNKDNDINAKDALEILKKSVGKQTCF